MKGSRNIRESRPSLTSESDGYVVAYSNDENISPSRATRRASASVQGWAAFEHSVKCIDDVNPEYFVKKPKPNFVSSGTFQKVMVDMYGNAEYGNTKGYTVLKMKLNKMARATGLASRFFNNALAKGEEHREREKQDDSRAIEDDVDLDPHEAAVREAARRGWRMLKRHVNEKAMANKLQGARLSWTMLSHTVHQMTNTYRARQDLYERYGIVPTKLPDGRVVCENLMLSERARNKIYGDGQESQNSEQNSQRPSSYRPPPFHLRSKTQLGFQQREHTSAENYRCAKRSSCSGRKLRPKTAK